MKKHLITLIAVVIAGLAGYLLWDDTLPAPNFNFTTLTGQRQSLAALHGHVVLVNFWATSCSGCVEEMPQIREMYRQYAKDGFEVVAVAMSYDAPNYVKAFTEQYKLPFMVTLDTQGGIAEAFGGIQLTPTSYLIDKQGKIVKRYVGVMDFQEIKKLIGKSTQG
jgi:peroxiredoxin